MAGDRPPCRDRRLGGVEGSSVAERPIPAHTAPYRREAAQPSSVGDEPSLPTGTTVPAEIERFDAVLALEVVEHVANLSRFIADIVHHVAPCGMLLCSTINRTWKSWLFAIVGEEIVFRILPRGTHARRRFVRPEELSAAAAAGGLHEIDLRGMRYLPVLHHAYWIRDHTVNFISAFGRPRSDVAARS